MTVALRHDADGKYLELRVSGKLHKDDYETFTPEIERLIQEHGKIRMLLEMDDFHGWDVSALWEDLKFDFRHFRDIERIAMVGEKKWHAGMAKFCKPFTTAKIKYFDKSEAEKAREWIGQH